VSYIENGSCRLISRKQSQYKSFTALSAVMAELPVKNAILDGEIVCLDHEGRSQFLQLMRRRKTAEVTFYGFDLLWLDGTDLRQQPLPDRKQRLQELLKGHPGPLYAEHIPNKGVNLFKPICQKDLEGIVCKHKAAPYSMTPQSWFKVINPDYSQHRGRREMFEKFRTRTEHVTITAY
jgi:bifunctional non-homologous end joining protein LigD